MRISHRKSRSSSVRSTVKPSSASEVAHSGKEKLRRVEQRLRPPSHRRCVLTAGLMPSPQWWRDRQQRSPGTPPQLRTATLSDICRSLGQPPGAQRATQTNLPAEGAFTEPPPPHPTSSPTNPSCAFRPCRARAAKGTLYPLAQELQRAGQTGAVCAHRRAPVCSNC